jgi:hypothetical protein
LSKDYRVPICAQALDDAMGHILVSKQLHEAAGAPSTSAAYPSAATICSRASCG